MSEQIGEEEIPRDYLIRSPFVTNDELSFLEAEIVKMYKKSRPDFFKSLEHFYKKFDKVIDEHMYRIEEELQYYLVFYQFQKDMEVVRLQAEYHR